MSSLISVETALDFIARNAPEHGTETIRLDQATGRTLAATLIAKVARPPASVSAMDGYALALSDVETPGAVLKVIGEAPAGTPFNGHVKSGEAVRIFTGGELPQGTDHIIPQEVASRSGDHVTFENAYTAHKHIRKAGLDFQNGTRLLDAGTRIGPAELSVAAAANHATLTVYTCPKVALLANGDELKPPGTPLSSGQIVNSNPAALSALIAQWGGAPIDLGIAPDNVAAISNFIAKAEDADIIVPIGGASVGDHDYMRAAFAGLGYETLFEKIAVRPGKPTWFASKGDQRVLGLPGNPASALVCAHLFLAPLISGRASHSLKTAALSALLPANGSRTSFLRAHVGIDETGRLIATPAANQDSSLLTPFLTANGLIRRNANAPELSPGAPVDILMIGPL